MGSGKTTLGRAVARRMGMDFIDLDAYIENRRRRTVAQLFAELGADGFRRIERTLLEEVAEFQDVVVACGGGTPCYFDNMRLMGEKGLTVWLSTSAERLYSRLTRPGAKAKRPVIAGKTDGELMDFIVENLREREPFYSQAALKFDASEIETAEETDVTAGRFAELASPMLRQ